VRAWRWVAWVLACLPVALCGCFPRTPRTGRGSVPKQPTSRVILPERVEARRPRIWWQQARPNGDLWRQMDVEADRGTVDPDAESGTLHNARGTLYSRNVPRARFEAPVVVARKDRRTVIAPAGARITSIAPPGISVVADRVTWRASLSRIVAEGNVRFVHQPPGAPRPVAWGGPFDRVTVNTDLERLTIP